MLLLFWAAGNRDPDKLEQPDAIRLDRTRSITLDPRRPPRWVRSLQVRRYDQLFVNLEPA